MKKIKNTWRVKKCGRFWMVCRGVWDIGEVESAPDRSDCHGAPDRITAAFNFLAAQTFIIILTHNLTLKNLLFLTKNLTEGILLDEIQNILGQRQFYPNSYSIFLNIILIMPISKRIGKKCIKICKKAKIVNSKIYFQKDWAPKLIIALCEWLKNRAIIRIISVTKCDIQNFKSKIKNAIRGLML